MSGAEHLNSITEATGSLVEILDSLETPASTTTSADYSDTFAFNNKDLVLYALGGEWSWGGRVGRFPLNQIIKKILTFSWRNCKGFY